MVIITYSIILKDILSNSIILLSYIVCNVTLSIANCSASSKEEDCEKAFDESDHWLSTSTGHVEWIKLNLDHGYYITDLQLRQDGSYKARSVMVVFSDGTEVNSTLEQKADEWLNVELPTGIVSRYINITTLRENRTHDHMSVKQVRVGGCQPGT